MTLVCFLPKGELSVLAHYIAAPAKRTNFARISARHVEKLWHRRRLRSMSKLTLDAALARFRPGRGRRLNHKILPRALHLACQRTTSSLLASPAAAVGSNAAACLSPLSPATQRRKRLPGLQNRGAFEASELLVHRWQIPCSLSYPREGGSKCA